MMDLLSPMGGGDQGFVSPGVEHNHLLSPLLGETLVVGGPPGGGGGGGGGAGDPARIVGSGSGNSGVALAGGSGIHPTTTSLQVFISTEINFVSCQ